MKNKRIKYLFRVFIVLLFSLVLFTSINIKAQSGYIYSSDGKLIEASVGFTVTNDGIYNLLSDSWANFKKDNATTDFNSPSDLYLYTDEDGQDIIYIVDSSSNKLFLFDGSLRYLKTISQFELDQTSPYLTDEVKYKINTRASNNMSTKLWTAETSASSKLTINCMGLSGVYRAKRPKKNLEGKNVIDGEGNPVYEDIIYLCDTNNKQVLLLNADTYKVIQVVPAPTGVDFADKYQPTKIVTDSTGRMYVISVNVYEGILLMDYYGNFMRMVGVNYTTLSVWDAIKRNFKTEEQLRQETSILQTTFNNLTIDEKGFLYTVSGEIKNADGTKNSDTMIKKINQANSDVLKRNGYAKPKGDLVTIKTGTNAGGSNFSAITVNKFGVYTVSDTRQNRLFTYDNEGNLLYISGGSGVQITDISNAVAIAYQGEYLLVLDKGNKCVMRFEPTDFARKINKAVEFEFVGDSTSAADEWLNVINSNPAYELAYVGFGKKLYDEQRYVEAMSYFKKGADVKYYSRAYKMYRDDIIAKYFPYALIVVGGLVVLKITLNIRKKAKNKKPYDEGELL